MPPAMTVPAAVESEVNRHNQAAARSAERMQLAMSAMQARTTPAKRAGNISGSTVHHLLCLVTNSDAGAPTPARTASNSASMLAATTRVRTLAFSCIPS
jgi:hypothetical protein